MKRNNHWLITTVVIALFSSVVLVGCGGSPPICTNCPPPHNSGWTWVSGSKTTPQAGVYGTPGTASPTNVPGARNFTISWTDHKGNFWMFGGQGLDSNGASGELNDLWKFDGNNWTWVSGADIWTSGGNGTNQAGQYGTKGITFAIKRTRSARRSGRLDRQQGKLLDVRRLQP